MSDEGLCLLYEACRGVLVASRGEGWGLPLVEAAMHRRYVLARNLDVFREHGLPNILYFNDNSPEALSERLSELVVIGQNPAPSADLPSWSDCVEALLNKLGLIDLKELQAEPLRIASVSIVSYAQNFEDVLLWRALHDIIGGRYIDVGAHDPFINSVSLAFYNAGWRGVNVEPTPEFAARLREARPDDTVIEAAVSDKAGPIPFLNSAVSLPASGT